MDGEKRKQRQAAYEQAVQAAQTYGADAPWTLARYARENGVINDLEVLATGEGADSDDRAALIPIYDAYRKGTALTDEQYETLYDIAKNHNRAIGLDYDGYLGGFNEESLLGRRYEQEFHEGGGSDASSREYYEFLKSKYPDYYSKYYNGMLGELDNVAATTPQTQQTKPEPAAPPTLPTITDDIQIPEPSMTLPTFGTLDASAPKVERYTPKATSAAPPKTNTAVAAPTKTTTTMPDETLLATALIQQELERRKKELDSARAALTGGAESSSAAPAATTAAPAATATDTETPAEQRNARFLDLLMQNDDVRKTLSGNFEKREKEMRSRKAWAALSDGISTLGNLVGTSFGGFNQQQTYTMPFLHNQEEAYRELSNQTAARLRLNDYNLALAQAKAGATADPIALENLKHEHALSQIDRRGLYQLGTQDAITARNNASIESRNRNTDKNNATRTAVAAANNQTKKDIAEQNNATKKEIAEMRKDGGGVGGYTTQTTIEYDELGRKVGEKKTRTGTSGATTTTTTTSAGTTTTVKTDTGTSTVTKPAEKPAEKPANKPSSGSPANKGKKENPMGAPAQNGKKKKENPMG